LLVKQTMLVKERFYKILFLRIFLFSIFFYYSSDLHAGERQLIINRLLQINNLSFNFEQTTQAKVETGTCFLVFDNKLKCNYVDEKQKEIIINNNTLVIIQKKYDKIYYYPVSKSPFIKILNKNTLIGLVRDSDLELNDNIDLIYLDKNGKNITVIFGKKDYNLKGWKIKDEFQNEIYFTLKIQTVNTEINNNFFEIPSIN
jgi:outer membrane lipoprotein-sorting protein